MKRKVRRRRDVVKDSIDPEDFGDLIFQDILKIIKYLFETMNADKTPLIVPDSLPVYDFQYCRILDIIEAVDPQYLNSRILRRAL